MSGKRFLSRLAVLALLSTLVGPPAAWATYLRPDLENVPVERIAENLEAMAKKDPKDAKTRLNLARAHAMAYASKSDTAQVDKGRANKGVWFGFEPPHVPFKLKQTDDKEKLKAAKVHLEKAIAWYEETVKLAPDNRTAALGLAWCIDQSGDKEKAIKAYRQLIDEAWKAEKDMTEAKLGWHSVTAEAASYLIPLLQSDSENDAVKAEIKTLQDRSAQMQALPRPITPIVVPLRDGLTAADLEDRAASVAFDADGTGLKKRWTWITKDAGWLVYDPRGTGKVDSALQLFGNVSFWMFWDNGYQALAALDNNRDGVLKSSELAGLAIWQDANGNGVSDAGEVKPLSAWGIVAISCQHQSHATHAERIPFSPRGVEFNDGSTRATYDIVLRPR